MKLNVTKEVETKGWFLRAFLGDIAEWWYEEPFEFNGKEYTSIDDLEKDYPNLVGVQPPYYRLDPKEGTKTIKLCIDLETGKVLNWPEGVNFDFNGYRLVDRGRYEICDENGEVQVGYTGYVPRFLEIDDSGYGDYIQFHIIGDKVYGWGFDHDDYDSFFEE